MTPSIAPDPSARRHAGAEPELLDTRDAPTVLIVDDEPAILMAVARALGGVCHITTASTADDAWTLLGGAGYQLVLCDMMMPRTSGAELYERVMARDAALASRFVFLTGGSTFDAGAEFVAGHTDRVLYKPVRLADLRALTELIGAGAHPCDALRALRLTEAAGPQ